jgi:hypothetical protein
MKGLHEERLTSGDSDEGEIECAEAKLGEIKVGHGEENPVFVG